MTGKVPLAGWRADPSGRHQHRYWNGSQWTDAVADNGQQEIDPLGGLRDPAPRPSPTKEAAGNPKQNEHLSWMQRRMREVEWWERTEPKVHAICFYVVALAAFVVLATGSGTESGEGDIGQAFLALGLLAAYATWIWLGFGYLWHDLVYLLAIAAVVGAVGTVFSKDTTDTTGGDPPPVAGDFDAGDDDGTDADGDDTESVPDDGLGDDPGTGGSVDVVCTDLVDSSVDSAWQDVTGAIHATILVNNGCEAAQQLNDQSAAFTLATSDATIADATFDFSDDPVVIPAYGTSEGELVFGPETFVDLEAVELLGLGDVGTAGTASLGITYSYVCSDAPEGSSSTADVEVAGIATGTPMLPSTTDESSALARLQQISDADQPFLESDVIDQWVPQISSKKPDVVLPNGTEWDAISILEDNRTWREAFPRVRLLWSGNYSTFESTDFWVTVVAIPFATAEEANGWCDTQGLPAEDCYAKLISHTHGFEDSTELR